MHVAIITAGGAGMFCGSCMHDNTWARALREGGVEVSLIPTYTPIRVDEEDLSKQRVFFGGINVYLDARSRFWRRLPNWSRRWLDHPAILNLATRFAISNDASELGELTLAMLAGESGPEARQVDELVKFVSRELRPDVICFSNALLAGVLNRLRDEFDGLILCTLQGDDIFLDSLPAGVRQQVVARLSELCCGFDGFLVHSNYYQQFMSGLLNLDPSTVHQIPLGIDVDSHDGIPHAAGETFRIGYFARICPEKGLHVLIDEFRRIRKRYPQARLVAAGYLGSRDRKYFERVQRDATDLGDAFEYIGSPPDHAAKVQFLKSLDVLSVPTVYQEPKGLYVLEALANGVPVVQPAHGSFPEIIEQAGGGVLFDPHRPGQLAESLESMITDEPRRLELAQSGQSGVRECFSLGQMQAVTIRVFEQILCSRTSSGHTSAGDIESA